mgnify:CR=1 FL=1
MKIVAVTACTAGIAHTYIVAEKIQKAAAKRRHEETEKNAKPKKHEPASELTADDLIDYYGIEADKVADCAAVQDACGYKDEIVIIKAVDDTSAKEIADLLNEHIEYQKESMKNYDPAQYEILGSSEVITNGVYVAMFISAEQSTMAEIFNGSFK